MTINYGDFTRYVKNENELQSILNMNKNIPKTERIYKKNKPIDHLSSSQAISLIRVFH